MIDDAFKEPYRTEIPILDTDHINTEFFNPFLDSFNAHSPRQATTYPPIHQGSNTRNPVFLMRGPIGDINEYLSDATRVFRFPRIVFSRLWF